MKPSERKNKLEHILLADNSISISELSSIFNVSIATIYKDLQILKKEHLIDLNLSKSSSFIFELTDNYFASRYYENAILKKEIAKEAVKLINNNDTIAIDSSTTCFFLCKEIKISKKKINVVTNSILIPIIFFNNPNVNVISTGGILGTEIASLIKCPLDVILDKIIIQKFFQSCFAFSENLGILDEIGRDDITVREAFFNAANKNILLVDSSKFAKSGSYNWLGLEQINIIVTDNNLDKKVIGKLKNKGVDVIVTKGGGAY